MSGESAAVLHEFVDVATQKVPGGYVAFSDSLTDLEGEPSRLFAETRLGAVRAWFLRFAAEIE